MTTIRSVVPSEATRGTAWLGVHVDIFKALAAGAIAGAVFLLLELLATVVLGETSPVGPAYVTLHGIIGAEYAAGSAALIVASVVLHFVLAMVLALPLAIFVHPWKDILTASAVGAVFGFALYIINFRLMGLFIPALADFRDAAMIVNYGVYGAGVVVAYFLLRRRSAPSS
jgi:hypothetical protein